MNNPNSNEIIEHIFRHEYGKIVAILVHKFSPSNIEKIEDAVQDALLKAMQVWAYKSIPHNPTAWLLKVANNNLIDILRRDKKSLLQESDSLFDTIKMKEDDIFLNNTINDSQLKMIFACCNPALSTEYQIILSLKLIGGFSNKEISKALLKKEDTVAKSFTRAKQQLKKCVKTLDIPVEMGLNSRVNVVLKVIYLLFSEGYKASSGENILKKDICFEAIRLALLLLENKSTTTKQAHALIALMCFHTSRFEARVNDNNELVDLEHQDRSKYDRELITFGIQHFGHATETDDVPVQYFLQAAISYYHCVASDFNSTNWGGILNLYNHELKYQYSPIIELNRLVPYYKLYGAKKGLVELERFEKSPNALKNALFYSIKAELYKELNDKENSRKALDQAINLTDNEMQKKHLNKKLENIS